MLHDGIEDFDSLLDSVIISRATRVRQVQSSVFCPTMKELRSPYLSSSSSNFGVMHLSYTICAENVYQIIHTNHLTAIKEIDA